MGGPTKVVEDFGQSVVDVGGRALTGLIGTDPLNPFPQGTGGGGGGGIFGDISNAFTQITQPIEKAVTAGVQDTSKNLTTVLQPVEKAATEFVHDPSKATTNVLQPVEKAVTAVAQDPKALAAIAFAVAAPYAAAELAPYLSGLGSYAGVAADAITGITIQVAQGVPIEKATENALVNVAVSGATGAVQQQIGKVISSPGVTNAITSTVSSGLATAAKGGSQADVEKAMTAGLAGSTASTIYKEAVDSSSDVMSRAVGGAASGAVTGGTEGAVIGGLQGAASALGKKAAEPNVAAPLDQTAAEDARLARQEASIAGSTKGAYLPETPFAMPDQTEAETARLARQEASIAGSTKGAYLPAGLVEEPKQGAYLPDAGPEGLVAPEDASATEVAAGDTKTPYKADIFTSTYVTPKAKSAASTQALGQALGTTTGLTAYRGAGEIEGTGTGGQRKKVWNEESLKLKDALGV